MMFNLLAEGETSNVGSIIMLIVLFAAIVGLFIWQTISGKKKQKQAEETIKQLKVGDKVKTIGGVCGFVAEINDSENTFVLETGCDERKSYVKFDKGAIYQTAPAKTEEPEAQPVEKKNAKKSENKEAAEEPVKIEAEEKSEDK